MGTYGAAASGAHKLLDGTPSSTVVADRGKPELDVELKPSAKLQLSPPVKRLDSSRPSEPHRRYWNQAVSLGKLVVESEEGGTQAWLVLRISCRASAANSSRAAVSKMKSKDRDLDGGSIIGPSVLIGLPGYKAGLSSL